MNKDLISILESTPLQQDMRPSTRNRRSKQAFWKKHMEGFERSGLGMSQYIKKHQLALHQFIYWRKKLRNSVRITDVKNEDFIPVQLSSLPLGAFATLRVEGGGELILHHEEALKVCLAHWSKSCF